MPYFVVGTLVILLILFLIYKYFELNSKLKHNKKELSRLQEAADKKLQVSQDFVSTLSQELRIPLYGIMGLTNLLAQEHPELRENKNLKSLKFSGDYLLNLINNILQVNYINFGEIIPDKKPFNLSEITENIMHSFSYATENSNNTLHFEFDPDIPKTLKGNSAILSQILMNLISNALRFTKNGNVFFTVNLISQKGNINNISFKVKHDGNEITKEDETSIYQEFINIEKVKKTYLGTGLNAAIMTQLAESIEGEIVIQKNSSAGSEYAFVIDLETPEIKTNKSNNTATNNKQKVLVVDDNKLNLLVADKILSKENFECTTVDNGFDAIKLAKENKYDIILMDINMPKLNGIGTTKKIREFDTKTPIIALTAVDVTQLNRQIISAGLNDYILKPYDKNLLLEMIRKHILNLESIQ